MMWLVYSASVVAVGILLVYIYQDNLLYYPGVPTGNSSLRSILKEHKGAREIFIPPNEFGLESCFEEVFFTTEDSVKIQAYLILALDFKRAPTLIYFHGNAGNLSHRLVNIEQLRNAVGVNVLIVSYRGYGKSEGAPTEDGIKKDAVAALRYLERRHDINTSNIFLFGRSLGGAVALHLCSIHEDRVKGVIVENTFTSVLDMIDVAFPVFSRFKFLSRNRWESLSIIGNITKPICFISGGRDELVPAVQMKRLFDAAVASTGKEWLLFPLGRHMDTWQQPNYYKSLKSFIFKHAAQK